MVPAEGSKALSGVSQDLDLLDVSHSHSRSQRHNEYFNIFFSFFRFFITRKYRVDETGRPNTGFASFFGKIVSQKTFWFGTSLSIDTHTGFGGFGMDDSFPNITSQTFIFCVFAKNPGCFFGLRTQH